MQPVTEAEFADMLATFASSAFRLEARDFYAIGIEADNYRDFLDGHPQPPSEVDWWQDWLDQISQLTAEGRTISRVRVLAEPPTDYQRWLRWADPWHAAAGERIRYIPRTRAWRIGLPLRHDWWLLDEERVILMEFTPDGEIGPKTLITDPDEVFRCLAWRDLAIRNSSPAEQIPAA